MTDVDGVEISAGAWIVLLLETRDGPRAWLGGRVDWLGEEWVFWTCVGGGWQHASIPSAVRVVEAELAKMLAPAVGAREGDYAHG